MEIEIINLTDYEMAEATQEDEIREIIDGQFLEGKKVTVNIDGHIITRRVFWSAYFQDLAVRFNGYPYTYSEFWNR